MSGKYKTVEVSFEEYELLREAGVWTNFKIHFALDGKDQYAVTPTFYTRIELEQDE